MIKPKVNISDLIESEDMVQILSRCYTAAREAGWSIEKTRKFSEATTAKDFEQFIATIDTYFEIEDLKDAIFDSICKKSDVKMIVQCKLCGTCFIGASLSVYALMTEYANNTSFHICDDGNIGILEVIGGAGSDADAQASLRQIRLRLRHQLKRM